MEFPRDAMADASQALVSITEHVMKNTTASNVIVVGAHSRDRFALTVSFSLNLSLEISHVFNYSRNRSQFTIRFYHQV